MQPLEFKEWRKSLGLTQDQAGQRLGVSRITVQNWESGTHPISAMVGAACERELQRWRQRPNYGPVALIYADGPMWVSASGRFPRMHREPLPNNDAAIARAVEHWEQSDFHNPLIVDAEGNAVWVFPQLKAEVERRLELRKQDRHQPKMADKLLEIGRQISKRPVEDDRSDEEILGYDPHGVPR